MFFFPIHSGNKFLQEKTHIFHFSPILHSAWLILLLAWNLFLQISAFFALFIPLSLCSKIKFSQIFKLCYSKLYHSSFWHTHTHTHSHILEVYIFFPCFIFLLSSYYYQTYCIIYLFNFVYCLFCLLECKRYKDSEHTCLVHCFISREACNCAGHIIITQKIFVELMDKQ